MLQEGQPPGHCQGELDIGLGPLHKYSPDQHDDILHSPDAVAVDDSALGLGYSLQLVDIGHCDAEKQVHEDKDQHDEEYQKKYLCRNSSLGVFHEGVGEVQFPHQHGEDLQEGGVQPAEVVRAGHESVEHEAEGQEDDAEGEEKSTRGHSDPFDHEDMNSKCWKLGESRDVQKRGEEHQDRADSPCCPILKVSEEKEPNQGRV